MPTYEFQCEISGDTLLVDMDMRDVPKIGQFIKCPCPEEELVVHDMQRKVQKVAFAEVPGTPTNKIGMALEDRAELGRRRWAERKKGL